MSEMSRRSYISTSKKMRGTPRDRKHRTRFRWSPRFAGSVFLTFTCRLPRSAPCAELQPSLKAEHVTRLRAAACISTQLALLPPCDPASIILLSGGVDPMSGAATNRRGLGIAAADPSGHRVGGHQSSAAETSRANMRRPDRTTPAKMQKRRAQASQAEALSCFILSRCRPTCLQRGTCCTVHPATENPQLLYNLELKKNPKKTPQQVDSAGI